MPILILFIIIKYRKRNLLNCPTQLSSCKYQLGYFYLGYKDKVFYWEFIRIAERLLIITAFLIFYDYRIQQSCVIALIIIAYSLLVHRFHPNDSINMQKTEYYSNLV